MFRTIFINPTQPILQNYLQGRTGIDWGEWDDLEWSALEYEIYRGRIQVRSFQKGKGRSLLWERFSPPWTQGNLDVAPEISPERSIIGFINLDTRDGRGSMLSFQSIFYGWEFKGPVRSEFGYLDFLLERVDFWDFQRVREDADFQSCLQMIPNLPEVILRDLLVFDLHYHVTIGAHEIISGMRVLRIPNDINNPMREGRVRVSEERCEEGTYPLFGEGAEEIRTSRRFQYIELEDGERLELDLNRRFNFNGDSIVI